MPNKPAPQCPKCRGTQLQNRRLGDEKTRMDVCPKCLGGWFDQSELDNVLSCAVDDLEMPDDPERTSCVCPKCFVPLARIDYPETTVEVDVCEKCGGLWLDRGEFREINIQRAEFQDRLKFHDQYKPTTLRAAIVQFVDRILVKYVDIS